jgi:CRISPR-associated protein Csx14
MKYPEPNITVKVDVTNPGQFFACCGLLELADRLWPSAEGWFGENDQKFCVTGSGTLRELLGALIANSPTAVERLVCNGLEIAPIIAPLAFSFGSDSTSDLVLDAWARIAALKGTVQVISNPPWNFWSGQQTSMRIWSSLRDKLAGQLKGLESEGLFDLFSQRLMQNGRFGFDPGPAWNALDVGFSPNEQGIEVESSPATELFAAIGLQRFRPIMNDERDGFDYFTWHNPYSPSVAAAAMTGALQEHQTILYRASVITRGQYAALDFAYPLQRRSTNE